MEHRSNGRVTGLQEMTELLAKALIKLIEKERGKPFGVTLGILAKCARGYTDYRPKVHTINVIQ